MPKEIYKKLLAVQTELVAPKSQYNQFGKYKYRRAEDILEAVKPLLKANGLTLIITDEPFFIEGRFYIKATATLHDGDESISASAYAREDEKKTGMDAAQLTGATSSYARKYAMNGLFCIDDNADPDVTNMGAGKDAKKTALDAIGKCKDMGELTDAWNFYGQTFGNDQEFRQAYAKRQMEIANGTAK